MSLSLLHSDWTHLDWGTHHKMPNFSKTKNATILKQFYMALKACQIKCFRDLQQTSNLFSIKLEVPENVPGIYSISVTAKAIIRKAR